MVKLKLLIALIGISFALMIITAEFIMSDSILTLVFWISFVVFAFSSNHLSANKERYKGEDL